MASPVKIQNFRYGVHLKFLRAFYTRPGINRVKFVTAIKAVSMSSITGCMYCVVVGGGTGILETASGPQFFFLGIEITVNR